jgi:hypothetical protein
MSSSFAMAWTDDEKQAAINFAEVFCTLMDKERDQLATHLADDAVLDWFGHTISSKDSVAGFMQLEVPETVHRFISVEPSGPIQHRKKAFVTADDKNNVMPSEGLKLLHDSLSNEELAKPLDNSDCMVEVSCSKESDLIARVNLDSLSVQDTNNEKCNMLTSFQSQFIAPLNYGIPVASEIYSTARHEEGHGDCHPKTSVESVTKVNRFLEAHGNVQFQHTKQPGMAPNNVGLKTNSMKWGRFCRLQIAYSINPNIWCHGNDCDGISGEFKIWLLVYQHYARCRRNLLEVFDQIK